MGYSKKYGPLVKIPAMLLRVQKNPFFEFFPMVFSGILYFVEGNKYEKEQVRDLLRV